jgi:hypothetical protein
VDHISLGALAFANLKIADSTVGAVITYQGGSDMTLAGIHANHLTQVDLIV